MEIQIAWKIAIWSGVLGAVVGAILALVGEYFIRTWRRMIERPKLKFNGQWTTPKKNAKSDNGKPFSLYITGVSIENELLRGVFSREMAEISRTKIMVYDRNGNPAINSFRWGRWWDYKEADKDKFFPKNDMIPQDKNPWVEIPAGTSKNLVIVYWIVDEEKYYIVDTSNYQEKKWKYHADKIKGSPPFYVKIDFFGKTFNDTKRFVILKNVKNGIEIKEQNFPFRESW